MTANTFGTKRTIRVLVADDSAVIRELIGDALAAQPDFEVVGLARDGYEALTLAARLTPDVITLDIQMPGLGGLETLERLLAARPVPVVMVSALTRFGADVSLDALDRGAMDYVAKPENVAAAKTIFHDELPRKLRAVVGIDVARTMQLRRERRARTTASQVNVVKTPPPTKSAASQFRRDADRCVAIGISTGGPPALATLFAALKGPLPPIIVVQHMPAQFTKSFAERLNGLSELTVKEAEHGEQPLPDHAYVAPGGRHLGMERRGATIRLIVRDGEPVSGHRPSVDVLMTDAAKIYGPRCLGAIMTGMGRDGSDGCGAIRAAGGYVLGQDQATSDVYGMNKVAFLEGNVDRQFSLDDAAHTIMREARRIGQTQSVGV